MVCTNLHCLLYTLSIGFQGDARHSNEQDMLSRQVAVYKHLSLQHSLFVDTSKAGHAPGGAARLLRSFSAWQPQSSVAAAAPAELPPGWPVCSLFLCSGPSDPSDTVPVPFQHLLSADCARGKASTEDLAETNTTLLKGWQGWQGWHRQKELSSGMMVACRGWQAPPYCMA